MPRVYKPRLRVVLYGTLEMSASMVIEYGQILSNRSLLYYVLIERYYWNNFSVMVRKVMNTLFSDHL